MTDRDARRDALSVWFMECSVLWAVFPLLDQLVENRTLDPRLISWSIVISLTTLTVGVILKRGERRWNGGFRAHRTWGTDHRTADHPLHS